MQLISNFNKGFRFLLSGIDIFSKYAWEKVLVLLMLFKKYWKNIKGKKYNRKPNKMWVDKGSKFHNSSFKND